MSARYINSHELLLINFASTKVQLFRSSRAKALGYLEALPLNPGETALEITISMERMTKLGYFPLTKRNSSELSLTKSSMPLGIYLTVYAYLDMNGLI